MVVHGRSLLCRDVLWRSRGTYEKLRVIMLLDLMYFCAKHAYLLLLLFVRTFCDSGSYEFSSLRRDNISLLFHILCVLWAPVGVVVSIYEDVVGVPSRSNKFIHLFTSSYHEPLISHPRSQNNCYYVPGHEQVTRVT